MLDSMRPTPRLSDRFIAGERSRMHGSLSSSLHVETALNLRYQTFLSKMMIENDSWTNIGDMRSLLSSSHNALCTQKKPRFINPTPFKILDAPDLRDDYYFNLLDWSSRGVLSIGLGEKAYLYSPSGISQLCEKPDELVSSVNFHPEGSSVAVGLSSGNTQIYDAESGRLVKTLQSHSKRVSSLAFTYGLVFTGSQDCKIFGHDIRRANSVVMKLNGHKGEVCGLKHDPCGLASGANDNNAMIWDLSMGRVRFILQGHKAAVKGVAWCPWQRNLLATGGGTGDETMRFWNTENGALIKDFQTRGQVCALLWGQKDREILSSHRSVDNQLSLWKLNDDFMNNPSCSLMNELHGHSQRVLHMALSPDKQTVCTASADETIRFWKIFDADLDCDMDFKKHHLSPSFCTIR